MIRMKFLYFSIFLLAFILNLQVFMEESLAEGKISVTTIDFLKVPNVTINAAGPLIVKMDVHRNRLIVANTLSSSLSIIDGQTHSVENIPLEGRTLQHLKEEVMIISRRTGDVFLIGTKCFFIISPKKKSAIKIPTDIQFESITVDEATGNLFLAGRESKSLGFLKAPSTELKMLKWLDKCEDLINLNQTPPPPIRRVISDNELNQVVAIDGYTSTIYLFDAKSGKQLRSRPIELASGGRWHLAGYNEKDHFLFLVTETDRRKVVEAARIDIMGSNDAIVPLPEFSEGVGIRYNPRRDEVYISYDNHPSVHVVNFESGGTLDEIKIPAYGNDGSAIDVGSDLLYIASWAFGEVDVIDLKTRRMLKRITGLGIIPHMFSIAFNPNNNLVYFPKGATAVNGTFGAALSVLDPRTEEVRKIHIGWAPVDLIELKSRNSFLIFNSEDQFAEVRADGSFDLHSLTYDYPIQAIQSPERDVYLSYGPHQSYWPTVYIWDAKNGILTIDPEDFTFYDRRIPRQAHKMVLDKNGVLYFTQNNWGKEEQFLGTLEDQIRVFESSKRIILGDEVKREITQRILHYDTDMHRLYLIRVGEGDDDPSLLQVIDLEEKKVIRTLSLGLTSTDLLIDHENLYISNFDSNSVSVINKKSFEISEIETGEKPLKLCRCGNRIYAINHIGNSLQEVNGRGKGKIEEESKQKYKGKEEETGKIYKIPYEGMPDNIFTWKDKVIITLHNSEAIFFVQFDPEEESFTLLHKREYPYGDTSFDSRNVSFYVKGQFGDALFTITKGKVDQDGRLWITDFLSGKLFILENIPE